LLACLLACLPACLLACLPACLLACFFRCSKSLRITNGEAYGPFSNALSLFWLKVLLLLIQERSFCCVLLMA
jgi:hypothetical protein